MLRTLLPSRRSALDTVILDTPILAATSDMVTARAEAPGSDTAKWEALLTDLADMASPVRGLTFLAIWSHQQSDVTANTGNTYL